MEYDPNLHRRRSIRYKGYDYSQEGAYFITLNIFKRQHLLGQVMKESMRLNCFGEIVAQEWLRTKEIRANITLGEFIIMPNHLHGIIHIDYSLGNISHDQIGKFQSPSHTIGAIVRGFKGASTRKIKEILSQEDFTYPAINAPDKIENKYLSESSLNCLEIDLSKSIWQRNYFEHIIRNRRAYQSISAYIRNNPRRWSLKHQL